MDWGWFLLSFKGRINRAKYWVFFVAAFVAMVLLGGTLIALSAVSSTVLMLFAVAAVVVYLALLYAGLAVGAKRLHDRDKSAWWLLVFFVLPGVLSGFSGISGSTGLNLLLGLAGLAIGIWGFVELGCLGGTVGPNQYGPDPILETAARTR